MSFEVDFSQPWLEVTEPQPSPLLIPQWMEVSIAGRPYVLDTSFEPYRRDAFRHRSIQAQRESISLDNIPGTGTVNTEGLWRREADDWHFGAGQPYQDRKDSLDSRFSTSKGVNPWMQWQVELLEDTKKVLDIAANGQVMAVGQYVYALDRFPGTLKYSSDLITWHSVTFTSPPFTPALTMMATDGYNVWISDESNGGGVGVWATTAGASTATAFVTPGGCSGVWYVADRLLVTGIASVSATVYDIVSAVPAILPTPLWTHPNPKFLFTDMAAGSSQIYISGYAPNGGTPTNSVVYRTTIDSNGVALTIPVQALPMAGGEYVTKLYGYLNFIFVGTNLGVRMCRTLSAYDPTGNQGDLEAGPLFPGLFPPGPIAHPIQAMVGDNRFLYFGWSDYDTVSTGLGRADLSTFIDTQSPAFTSDLMVTGAGLVISADWCPINNRAIFVVQSKGVYTATGSFVESGYITSGSIGYGISDDKIAWAGDIGTVSPQQGTVTMSLASDAGSNIFAFVGQQVSASQGGTPNQSVFPISQIRGEQFTLKLGLIRDPMTAESPIMHRWTLKALPAVTAGTTISLVLRMWDIEEVYGQDVWFDPYVEKAFIENLRTTQTAFTYIEGPYSCTAVVDEVDWLPQKRRDAIVEGGFEGNLIVYIKTLDIGA